MWTIQSSSCCQCAIALTSLASTSRMQTYPQYSAPWNTCTKARSEKFHRSLNHRKFAERSHSILLAKCPSREHIATMRQFKYHVDSGRGHCWKSLGRNISHLKSAVRRKHPRNGPCQTHRQPGALARQRPPTIDEKNSERIRNRRTGDQRTGEMRIRIRVPRVCGPRTFAGLRSPADAGLREFCGPGYFF